MGENRWSAEMKIIAKGNLLAVGDVTLDKVIKIKNVKVLSLNKAGKEFYLIDLPKQKVIKGGKTTWNSVCRTLTPESRESLEKAVMDSLWEEMRKDLGFSPDIDVEICPVNKGSLRACVKIVYEKFFEINNIKLLQGKKGLYISYPQFPNKDTNLVYPETELVRNIINNKILYCYEEYMSNMKKEDYYETYQNYNR